ncbi:SusC/RagA family TonB-linked outer membrane protein [Olivibacter sitiensis]|uniref:SusC/RagA family TonB-linked outer membrane protein n=1 Tax=Olivibacter sitiensis TaxID=376470 RepID=UPI001B7FEB42|nr:TonB-dependent receptor [Olivibacter sitiensis]
MRSGAIKQLQQQSGVEFVFDEQVLQLEKILVKEMDANAQPLQNVLNQLLSGTAIEYTQKGRQAVLLSKKQEPGIISGRVVDTLGMALPGATIRVVELNQSTGTDKDGNYSISVKPGIYTVEASFVSYEKHVKSNVTVAERQSLSLDFVLTEALGNLDEVIVVGYGIQKRENLAGSVVAIQSDEIVRAPVANITSALAGRLPGLVSLQSNGRPGNDQATLSIRGFGSPLILIDGVEGDINTVDPNEIASISVLKDASASIYGARAGNGVIMVTTKRGVIQAPSINFKSVFTAQGNTLMPTMSSSGQLAEILREGHIQSGQPVETAPYTEEEIQKFYAGTDPQYPNTDWFNLLVRDWAPQQQHNISVRGGSDKVRYYGLFGYLNQQTVMKRSDASFERFNLRSNLDAYIAKGLKARVDFSSIIRNNKFPYRGMTSNFFGDLWNTSPVYPAAFPDPSKISYAGGGGTGGAHITSDRSLTGYNDGKDQDTHFVLDLTYDFDGWLQGLQVRSLVDYLQGYGSSKQFQIPVSFYNYDYAADIYTLAGNFGTSSNLNLARTSNRQITSQSYLGYKKIFNQVHDLHVLGIYEVIDYFNDRITAARSNFLTSSIDEMLAGSTSGMTNSGSTAEMGRKSIIGRVNYTLLNRYILESSLRVDASAKFAPESRWGYFPGVSLAWKISDERFLQSVKNLDMMKLRLSYGTSGNDGIGNFQYLAGYSITDQNSGGSYLFGNDKLPGIVPRGLANVSLTWERLKTYNVGLDVSLWKEFLYFNLDAFYRQRDGIPAIRSSSLPGSFGAVMPTENLNSKDTRGFDLMLASNHRVGDFSWNVAANISWSRSKWTAFDEPNYSDLDQERINKQTGHWDNRTFGYLSGGLFTSQEEIDQLPYDQDLRGNSTLRPGDVKYLDVNGDGEITWRDQVEIGKGNFPMWMGGFNGSVKYRSFDLSFLFQGAFGYNIFANGRQAGMVSTFFYENRWTEQNNVSDALVPRVGGAASNGWTSTYNQIDASYLRLKNIHIGYTFDSKVLRTQYINNIRLFFAGTNLFTWSKLNKYDIDPEAPTGMGGLYYPQQRTLSAGLELTF